MTDVPLESNADVDPQQAEVDPQQNDDSVTNEPPNSDIGSAANEAAVRSSDSAQPQASSNRNIATAFIVAQLVFWVGIGVYGSHRYQLIEEERFIPVPSTEAVRVKPLHDRPEVVSDEELVGVLNKLRPRLRGPRPKINHVDHALRFWGVEARFPGDEDSISGVEMRELLTDHRRFMSAWGDDTRPFLLPNTRGSMLAFRTRSGSASASHVDHTLAGLAEVGTPLDYPVHTMNGELPLRAAFDATARRFSLNQTEYEWSVLVFLHYYAHLDHWFTTEGQRVTWDLLAQRLMRQRLAQGVCYGNHRLYTLAILLRVDETNKLLSPEYRDKVIAHLSDVTRRLEQTQHADGYWDGKWPGEEWDGPQLDRPAQPLGKNADRILATGHAMEWWAMAPESVHPAPETLKQAGRWLVKTINDLSDAEVKRYYTFLSHAGRSLALWRGKEPAEAMPKPLRTKLSKTQKSADNKPNDDASSTSKKVPESNSKTTHEQKADSKTSPEKTLRSDQETNVKTVPKKSTDKTVGSPK